MKFKLFTLVILFTVATTNLFSQPKIKNQKTIGGSGTDFLSDMVLCKNGELLLGGYSISNKSGEKATNSKGDYDYWIVKLDKNNKIEWDKTIGGSGLDHLSAIQQTGDSGYVLGGYSNSNISGDKTESSYGTWDYWVVKINNSGIVQWNKTIGGTFGDNLTSLQQTKDGGYLLGGYSLSRISGNKTAKNIGSYDYWIVKLDSAGNIQWDKSYGGTEEDQLFTLKQTKDGGYILGGYSRSGISGNKTSYLIGAYDYWVVKIDSKGNVLWNKAYGGTGYSGTPGVSFLKAIKQTDDGGYILGGFSNARKSNVKSQASKGGDDYWVIKTDSTGNVQWDKTIGGNSIDDLSSLDKTEDGGYILAGSSLSNISGDKTEASTRWDYWIVKLRSDGKVEWDKTIGSKVDDHANVIREISKNHYVAGGYSDGDATADKTDTSRGSDDYWIVYVNYTNPLSTTSNSITVVKQNLNNNFSVYPNPVKDVLHVQANGKATITISNQSGKILITKIVESSTTIDVSKFTPGIYYIKNTATGGTQQVTIIR